MADVFFDLESEADRLERLAGHLAGDGWTVARHFRHLIRFSRRVVRVVEEPATLPADVPEEIEGARSTLVLRWRSEFRKATEALSSAPKDVELAWPEGNLRPSVLAAALLTELFAHGQDVADGLGASVIHGDSVGHVAYYGVRTRDRGYLRNGLTPPAEPFRFDLVAPSGVEWHFGPEDASQRIAGPAVDFCLLVTRRRSPDALHLRSRGRHATHWLTLAEAIG